MKLLIVTQKVDSNDPILGFFHRWLEEFARHCEHVTVIGQYVGTYNLPENVAVISLHKEQGHSTVFQVFRFWYLQWKMRKQYDCVFVHMTPIWVALGSLQWLIFHKRMYLWYEAKGIRWPLRFASHMVRKIFSASSNASLSGAKKHQVLGHGIDTDFFKPHGDIKSNSIVTVGRITKAKRMDFLLQNALVLPKEYQFHIAGVAITHEDHLLLHALKSMIEDHNSQDRIAIQSLSQKEICKKLQSAQLFIHASTTPLDKAVLEAMACGCLVLTTNQAFKSFLPKECITTDEAFAVDMKNLLAFSPSEKEKLGKTLRDIVVSNHSLPRLITTLVTQMQD